MKKEVTVFVIRRHQGGTQPSTFGSQIAFARVATALAVTALGALAIGRLTIGFLAIEELEVGRLRVKELILEREAEGQERNRASAKHRPMSFVLTTRARPPACYSPPT